MDKQDNGHGFTHEELAYGAFCIYEEEKRRGQYSGKDAHWFAAIDRLTKIRARARPIPAGETVIWLGAGASYGSQPKDRAPPLTQTFFSDSLVQHQMRRYPVLAGVWQAFGEQIDLEIFWQAVDKGYNSPDSLPGCNIDDLEKRLRESASAPTATDEQKSYYRIYVNRLSSEPTSNYRNAVAVAGWELKNLLIDRLNRTDWVLTLHQRLFRSLGAPFAVITFNYDTIAEQALVTTPGFTYEESKDSRVLISKPHGSIQWEWRRPATTPSPNEFLKVNTETALSAFGVTSDGLFHDPLMIGLRTKRELTGEDSSAAVNRFWSETLVQSRALLERARRVIVVGFSFQEADNYLWDELSARWVGAGKSILVCDLKKSADERETLMAKMKKFFGTTDVAAYWDGFNEEFVRMALRGPS